MLRTSSSLPVFRASPDGVGHVGMGAASGSGTKVGVIVDLGTDACGGTELLAAGRKPAAAAPAMSAPTARVTVMIGSILPMIASRVGGYIMGDQRAPGVWRMFLLPQTVLGALRSDTRERKTGAGFPGAGFPGAGLFTILAHWCAEASERPVQFRSAAGLPDGLQPPLVDQKATALSGGGLLVSARCAPSTRP